MVTHKLINGLASQPLNVTTVSMSLKLCRLRFSPKGNVGRIVLRLPGNSTGEMLDEDQGGFDNCEVGGDLVLDM